jgi:hypothetical protein
MKNVLEIKLCAVSAPNSQGLMFPEWQIAVILPRSVYRAFPFLIFLSFSSSFCSSLSPAYCTFITSKVFSKFQRNKEN